MSLETDFRKWGMWSIISFGLGFLIISISSLIALLTDLNRISGTLVIAFLISIPVVAIQIYSGYLLIKIGKSFGHGSVDNAQLYQFAKFYSIIFILSGIVLIFDNFVSGIILFIAGIIAIIGLRSFSSTLQGEKAMGGILGIIAATLIVVSLSSGPTRAFSYSGFYSGINILPFAGIPLLIAAIGAFFYTRSKDKRTESISYIILAVSSLIFGLGILINALDPLTSSSLRNSFGWRSESDVVLGLFVAGAISLVISGFLTLAASVSGLVVFSKELSFVPQITPKAEEKLNVCQNCGAQIPADKKFCENCGTEIKVKKEMLCKACGAAISPQQKFCGSCGAKIEEVQKQEIKPTCPKCRFNIKVGDKFCEKCGYKFSG